MSVQTTTLLAALNKVFFRFLRACNSALRWVLCVFYAKQLSVRGGFLDPISPGKLIVTSKKKKKEEEALFVFVMEEQFHRADIVRCHS